MKVGPISRKIEKLEVLPTLCKIAVFALTILFGIRWLIVEFEVFGALSIIGFSLAYIAMMKKMSIRERIMLCSVGVILFIIGISIFMK